FARVALIFIKTNQVSESKIFVTLADASMGYVIAHSLNVSGPIDMVVACLFIGNNLSDRKKTSPYQVEILDYFWMVI
ncbi:sodium:proton antiporter, partial [Francisella tularensis subsp. holarctica]|nr:sodium:proton antiporter [Francisella tularensis subsp. holarctica]